MWRNTDRRALGGALVGRRKLASKHDYMVAKVNESKYALDELAQKLVTSCGWTAEKPNCVNRNRSGSLFRCWSKSSEYDKQQHQYRCVDTIDIDIDIYIYGWHATRVYQTFHSKCTCADKMFTSQFVCIIKQKWRDWPCFVVCFIRETVIFCEKYRFRSQYEVWIKASSISIHAIPAVLLKTDPRSA